MSLKNLCILLIVLLVIASMLEGVRNQLIRYEKSQEIKHKDMIPVFVWCDRCKWSGQDTMLNNGHCPRCGMGIGR